jgi:lysophosphatidic acid acyltransferase/lysophosphatidylinositol acyltransferase
MACEGTRFTERKRSESMKYAREKNLPELKHHILPRTRGLTMILQGAKGKSKLSEKVFFFYFIVSLF